MEKVKIGFKLAVGRNRGKISSYHRERGLKGRYSLVDFGRNLINVKGKIKFIKKIVIDLVILQEYVIVMGCLVIC